MQLYALTREISPYSGADILLGIFPDLHTATTARDSYLRRYQDSPATDPWHSQAYKPDGLTLRDLSIEPHRLDRSTPLSASEISVVSVYREGMGQITRKIDSLHVNRLLAEQRVTEIETESENADDWPSYCDVQTIRIGELQSDAPEDQPVR